MECDLGNKTKLIITADWHLRYDVPACRHMSQQEWIQHQKLGLMYLQEAAEENNAVVCCVGDIFHRAKEDVGMISVLMDVFGPEELAILPGNHDTPYHSLDQLQRSNYGVLQHYYMELDYSHNAGGLTMQAFPFGSEYPTLAQIVFTHQLTFRDEKSKPPMAEGALAQDHLKMWKDAKWVFCGDNHTPFTYTSGGRHVLNPGCLNRQSLGVAGVKPRAYLVDLETDKVSVIHLPDAGEVYRSTTSSVKLDDKVVAFLEKLHTGNQSTELSFKERLRATLQSQSLPDETRKEGLWLLEELDTRR